jgi:hypothetical protein
MFTEAERVQIRRWLGYSAMYASRDPILESAITSAQTIAEGGGRPDDTTEVAVRGWVTQLATIETKWIDLLDQMQAYKVEDAATVDPVRGLAGLKQIGRMYVGFLSDALSTPVKRDVFGSPTPTS